MPDGAVPLSSTRRPRPPIAVPAYLTPTSIAAVRELAELMAAGEWAPASYRGADGRYVVEKIVLGIMHGAAVGLGPFAAVHAIAVIDGQPTIWGDGALALVERSGLLEDKSEDYLVDDDEGLTAVCTMRRHPWPTPVIRRFSMAMAEAAGLTQKEGPWHTYPRRMLTMRARSWALRDGLARTVDPRRGRRLRPCRSRITSTGICQSVRCSFSSTDRTAALCRLPLCPLHRWAASTLQARTVCRSRSR
jgi:hypothetical protein